MNFDKVRFQKHIKEIKVIQKYWRKHATRKIMNQARLEYIKIFNSIEFETGIHRIRSTPECQLNFSNNLLRRPMHFRYKPIKAVSSLHVSKIQFQDQSIQPGELQHVPANQMFIKEITTLDSGTAGTVAAVQGQHSKTDGTVLSKLESQHSQTEEKLKRQL